MKRTELVASLTEQVIDKVPGKVYVRIDGLCGDKPLSYVKEAVLKASSERMNKFFNRFGLGSFCRR